MQGRCYTSRLILLSQPFLISQELFQVVISREFDLLVKVPVFSLNLMSSSISDLASKFPGEESSGPFLDYYRSLSMNLKFDLLLPLDFALNADDARYHSLWNLILNFRSIFPVNQV